MKPAPIPKNEKERLTSLYALMLLDTKPEKRFDRITRIATKIFNAPISTLTLVDQNREWFKSVCGLKQKEGNRAISFCGHALLTNNIFVVPDTKKDTRFSDNPMVIGKPYIRFYAGVPIMSADGQRLGVFCIKDVKPRTFSKEDKNILKGLASWAEIEINSRNLGLTLTEQKKLQKRLIWQNQETEELKAKKEAILKNVGDGLIAIDMEKKIIEMSHAAGELLGVIPSECLGKRYNDIWSVKNKKGDKVPENQRPIQIALTTGHQVSTSAHTPYFYVRKNGTSFPVAFTITPIILNGNHKMIGVVDVFRDVTKEKEIDRAKSEFVSLASHQLRTPLTGIEWTIELFSKKEKLTPAGKKYLNDIYLSSRRLSALIKLLLSVSHIESGKVDIKPEPLELVGLINTYIPDWRILCDKGKLSFIFTKHPDKLKITTDKTLLGHILENLVSNAINYTRPNGKIEVRLEEKNGVALLTVTDTGIGIPKKEQLHIFEKFIRASNAVAMKPDGTGLGLYIVSEVINLLGGKIRFESKENQGSAFYAELPIKSPPPRLGNVIVWTKVYTKYQPC